MTTADARAVWFPSGAPTVLVAKSDRNAAGLGVTMYTASRPITLAAQWAAWLSIRVLGARILPGAVEHIHVPEFAEIATSLRAGQDQTPVAQYRRKDGRSGSTFVSAGPSGRSLIKIRENANKLEREQRLLAAVQRHHPRTFSAPAPLGFGVLTDGRAWSAQEMVFVAPHHPCLRLPAGFEDELRSVLESVQSDERPSAGCSLAHGDLSPWNLRRDHRGRLWLFDWEDAAWAPNGADRLYFEAAVAAIRPRRQKAGIDKIDATSAEYWVARIAARLESVQSDDINRRMIKTLERVLG